MIKKALHLFVILFTVFCSACSKSSASVFVIKEGVFIRKLEAVKVSEDYTEHYTQEFEMNLNDMEYARKNINNLYTIVIQFLVTNKSENCRMMDIRFVPVIQKNNVIQLLFYNKLKSDMGIVPLTLMPKETETYCKLILARVTGAPHDIYSVLKKMEFNVHAWMEEIVPEKQSITSIKNEYSTMARTSDKFSVFWVDSEGKIIKRMGGK